MGKKVEYIPKKNLIGMKFGKLTVIEYAGYKKVVYSQKVRINYYWKCNCECGNIKNVKSDDLIRHRTESCGCIRRKNDLTGNRYGRLIVIKEAEPEKRKDGLGTKRRWECLCDCGNTIITKQELLVSGSTKSCGCLNNDTRHRKNPDAITNKYPRLFRIWQGIKNRCNRPNDQHHKNYYDKGVKVCKEWNDSFHAFLEWSLQNGYADNLTIDRIDTTGNYEPTNCRWNTNKEQQSNKRTNIKYEIDGEMLTIPQIAERYNIKEVTLYARINRYGYTIEEAISKPVKPYKRKN